MKQTTLEERLKKVYYEHFDKDGYVAIDTTYSSVLDFIHSELALRDQELLVKLTKILTPPEEWKSCLKVANGNEEFCTFCGFNPDRLFTVVSEVIKSYQQSDKSKE